MTTDFSKFPDKHGHFGQFGGIFAPETLMAALEQFDQEYESVKNDPAFLKELADDLKDYVVRPSALSYAERCSKELGGA